MVMVNRMSPETLTQTQMVDILKTEYEIIFPPKREFVAPTVPNDHLRILVGESGFDSAITYLDAFQDYLGYQAVGDQWGSKHEARRNWRGQMALKYGDIFLDVYYNKNQLRLNNMTFVRLSADGLSRLLRNAGKNALADKIKGVADKIYGKTTGEDRKTKEKVGPSYNELESLDDKLAIVHSYEDGILEILRMFSPQGN